MKNKIKTVMLFIALTISQSVWSAEQAFCDLNVSGSTEKIYKKFSGHSFGSYYKALGDAMSNCRAEGFTTCNVLSSQAWDPIWSVFVQVQGSKDAPNQSEVLRQNKCNKINECYEKMIVTQTNDPQLASGLMALSNRYRCNVENPTTAREEEQKQDAPVVNLGSGS